MHSALLWYSCHSQDEVAAEMTTLIKRPVDPKNLNVFFWDHLRKDVEHLSQLTNQQLDQAAIIIHLVLKRILKITPPTSKKLIQLLL